MKRVLVVSYDLEHVGGGSTVAAWILQALAPTHEVAVLTWRRGNAEVADRNFGTRLARERFDWFTVSPRVCRAMSLVPLPLAHLKAQILNRTARRLNQARRFDVIFGVMNEIDVGTTAVQYIHFPWAYWPRPRSDLRWFHFAPLIRAYHHWTPRLSGYDPRRVARNLTLANSDWTARFFEKVYGVRPRTLYPPVAGGFPEVPFEARARGFNCLGRISPEKRLVEVIETLAAVRRRGHDVNLQILGHVDSPRYLKRVRAASAPHRDWVSFHHDLSRQRLAELVTRNRYAIHGMIDEHFGIAPAELQRAGCITFVPDGGGCTEIVGRDERLVYHSFDDAVEKIDRVLSDPQVESDLQRCVEGRREQFGERRFVKEINAIVESFGSDTEASPMEPAEELARERKRSSA